MTRRRFCIRAFERGEKVKERKYGEILISIVCLIIIAGTVGVLTVGAGYTVLLGDDFTHGVRVGAFHVSFPSYLAASFRYVKDLYLDWQGTFFAMFLQAFLSPINNFGLSQLKAVMMGNALFFFLSLLSLLWVSLSFLKGEFLSLRLFILTFFFVAVTNADVYTEIYFWYSGAVAYSMPFSVLLTALTLLLLMNRGTMSPGKKRGCAICAGILLFLSSGGSLAVAGCGCYVTLLLTGVFYLRSRRISVPNIAVLAAGVIGALANVVAPGNFARHDGTAGAGLHFVQAAVYTVHMFLEETGRLFRETVVGLVFLMMIAAGLYLAGKCEVALREYGMITVLALGAGLAAYYPVALGYSSDYIPNRCYFIIDTTLVLSLLNLALFVGICLHRRLNLPADGRTISILLYICLAAWIVSPLSLAEMPLYRVARSVHNGTYRNYYEQCVSRYEYLETCPEEDVVLEMPDYIDDFECFYLDSDENGWVNVGLAEYYGKKTVRSKE